MRNNISILFWLFKSKQNKAGLAPLMLRITYRGEREQVSTGKFIPTVKWNAAKCMVKGTDENARINNCYIRDTTTQITGLFNEMIKEGDVDLQKILDKLFANGSKSSTLRELITAHNQDIKGKIGTDYTASTYKKYQVTQKKLIAFLQVCFKKKDIPLKDLSRSLIAEFDSYLKTECSNQHNTAAKHCKNLKRIINWGIQHEWLEQNPFSFFKTAYIIKEKIYLTKEELEQIQNKQFTIERLNVVKDLFLFACYTGLAFQDMMKLTGKDIINGIDGRLWLVVFRTKTKVRCAIPLLSQPLRIINKYNPDYKVTLQVPLLKQYSNQKYNSYLKEIADVCAIARTLTSHAARRTFATTVALANGVSIETISKVLGHSSVKITHAYAQVTDLKVSEEMEKVRNIMQ